MALPVVVISVVLFFVLFFGIGFLLNMILRKTWVMAFVYPVVIVWIVGELPLTSYLTDASTSFSTVYENILLMKSVDIIILSMGFVGALGSGVVIRMLRSRGYQMF
ncbi:YuiB-like putative membrane protein [Aureibacillus halotolerans]|uniref:YuiB-like putative membrane protein n=2 Tax=Aureibacillus halotolerans TaxID=1508390 RepID=A0A4V6PWI2_9BACI|nr:YuiB-like putative membrane protein [Aureibacillus halotolerans]